MIELFQEDSPFVQEDNRRFRPILPTSASSLNVKHDFLFPEHVVRGKTVLDIGSCTGSTGFWCSQLGATRYVGVEHQEGYVSLSRRLLQGSNGTEIVKASSDDYFAQNTANFDIVCLMGVAHGVYDPLSLIRECASRATQYFCFDDMGWHSEEPFIQAKPIVRMTMAGQNASSIGFGWSISPSAMDLIMNFLGFRPDMSPEFLAPYRWLCRYVRVRQENVAASFSAATETWADLEKIMNQPAPSAAPVIAPEPKQLN